MDTFLNDETGDGFDEQIQLSLNPTRLHLLLGVSSLPVDDPTKDYMYEMALEELDPRGILFWSDAEGRVLLGEEEDIVLSVVPFGLIGAVAGTAGDRWSLGFVTETECQVEAHLEGHLEALPDGDLRSRAIIEVMAEDEARHAKNAREAGGVDLPGPVKRAMRGAAAVMKWLAYRV